MLVHYITDSAQISQVNVQQGIALHFKQITAGKSPCNARHNRSYSGISKKRKAPGQSTGRYGLICNQSGFVIHNEKILWGGSALRTFLHNLLISSRRYLQPSQGRPAEKHADNKEDKEQPAVTSYTKECEQEKFFVKRTSQTFYSSSFCNDSRALTEPPSSETTQVLASARHSPLERCSPPSKRPRPGPIP